MGSVYGTDHGPFVSFSDFEGFLELLLRTGITVEIGRPGGGEGVPVRWVNTPLMTDFPTLPSFLCEFSFHKFHWGRNLPLPESPVLCNPRRKPGSVWRPGPLVS